MNELNPSEFFNIIPLLNGIKQKVLPQAICQKHSPGRVFVDAPKSPQLALIWSAMGYYFLAGDPVRAHNLESVGQVLREIFVPESQAGGESSFILAPNHVMWKEHLSILLPGYEIHEIYRRPFNFNFDDFNSLRNWRERIPPGFQIRIMDNVLAEQVGVLTGWTSMDNFIKNGLGVILQADDEIACVCFSVFASDEYMEIDIHTKEKFRRRGFAEITASVFIESCLQRGKQPNWECFWENDASTALALKLGFSVEPDYSVYYWEE